VTTTPAPIRIPGKWEIPYNYTIGNLASAFFEALGEQRIVGCRCSRCERVAVPPKSFCEYCFIPVAELVDVGNEGTIQAVTIVTAPFAGSPPVPYVVAYVKLDGATSSLANYVRGVDVGDANDLPPEIAIEAPVRVVFSEHPTGRITDFWFESAGTN
jgi:uncharacterized OB-fold protein